MTNHQNLPAYIEQGQGEALVLVHGFCESKDIWQAFIPDLAKNYRVIALDLGGFGESTDVLPVPTSTENLAEQINELLVFLNIRQCVLIGHSLGGYVSLAFAEKYPQKLKGLALFHSTALADSEERKKIRNNVIEFVEKNGVVPYIENFVPPLFYEKRKEELDQAISFVKEIAFRTPKQSIIEVMKAMRDRKTRISVLEQAAYPILFIIGKEDSSIPFETYASQIVLPKNAVVHIFHQTGHMGMFERERETRLILAYFAKLCLS